MSVDRRSLAIFTLTGERVYDTTASGNAGANSLLWQAQNLWGRSVASGLYIYSIQVDDGSNRQVATGKIAIIH